jgi:hypothetical protein
VAQSLLNAFVCDSRSSIRWTTPIKQRTPPERSATQALRLAEILNLHSTSTNHPGEPCASDLVWVRSGLTKALRQPLLSVNAALDSA